MNLYCWRTQVISITIPFSLHKIKNVYLHNYCIMYQLLLSFKNYRCDYYDIKIIFFNYFISCKRGACIRDYKSHSLFMTSEIHFLQRFQCCTAKYVASSEQVFNNGARQYFYKICRPWLMVITQKCLLSAIKIYLNDKLFILCHVDGLNPCSKCCLVWIRVYLSVQSCRRMTGQMYVAGYIQNNVFW